MNKDRLLKLADLLEADAANPKGVQFDLSSWVANSKTHGVIGNSAFDSGFPHDIKTINVDCGTTACAFGLAAISDVFKGEGLSWKFVGDTIVPVYYDSAGTTRDGFDAASVFFGITMSDAFSLFDPVNYPTKDRKGAAGELVVAKRIRKLIEDGYVSI